MIKKLLAGLSVGVILITGAVETAYAGFGTEIGVYFPAGGGSSGSSGSSVGYAGFTVDKVAQELTVEEKHGGLVMELCITNEGDTPYTIEHRDGQIYEFVILDKRGKVLWKWSEGMAFTQALTSSTVGAKDSVVYKAEIKRSDYKKIRDNAAVVTAFLKDTPYTISASIPERIQESGGSSIHGAIRIGMGNGRWYDD
ncbi:BsuPI-related putative proteinase inhibitor [Schwartzia succinivorans]|jgi:hypothetical protein|uniref:Intracellular proteinase inhibitor n=1 Tax=Schwartzia succinivorans DSM 10502 TaxID=1123243 RepID=A0A1M4TI43_9FIRM|nr:BsuPI-related putative proteinase inhibitor [Schwartzia succinivorans]MBQ3863339.1 hypothetical protein [Schwartzia sp. (in: firmicutes)]MBE6097034.1 hypothetical protein [Schwartzia succinivorans]MBQ4152358.1 hypothetical protein [Schwartzia sp. (in: firmicutes)]MCR5447698.1 hypothetical protein [Schwartzia sp. (in: firmicutes)]MDY6296467.1 BsuPI-related putative proteinase inhibitor [Schwartzia succinivorans]